MAMFLPVKYHGKGEGKGGITLMINVAADDKLTIHNAIRSLA